MPRPYRLWRPTRPAAWERQWWSGERALLGMLTLGAGAVYVLNDFGVVVALTKPEVFLAPLQSMTRYAAVWTDSPNLGTSNFNVGLSPVAALFGGVEWVGVPAWLAVRLWSLAFLVVGAWGARVLYTDLVAGSRVDSAAARVAAAVAYAANPYVVVGGGSLPTGLPYALLPWLVLWWRRGFRRPSWRTSAAAALVLTAMSGINVGVVPLIQLVVVVPLVVHARLADRVRWVAIVRTLSCSAVLFIAMALYWLVPSLLSLGVGTAITSTTETLDAINSANSYAEVLRGLGMWTLYGRGPDGAFQPGYLSYLLGPAVIIATFAGPMMAAVGAWRSRSSARLFAVLCVLVGAVVMIGSFPFADQTVWGHALLVAMDRVPGLTAFRTTNKAGGVLELGISLLVALVVAELAPGLRRASLRLPAVAAAGIATALGVAPALTGDLYEFPMPFPAYWTAAARHVNDVPTRADQRVMLTPGIHLAAYDWGYHAPDEIGNSLFRSQNVVHTTIPNGSPYAANLTSAVDQRLAAGTAPRGTMSTLARYLGVDLLVARTDVDLDSQVGALVDSQLSADAGLGEATSFGPTTRGAPHAVAVRPVTGNSSTVAVHPGSGAILVDGDGGALPDLQGAGLLTDQPAVLLAGAMTDGAIRRAVQDGARVVLTDSNQRREWSTQNLTGIGPLLGVDQTAAVSGALFDPGDQTVAVTTGAHLTTSGSGLLFGPFPQSDPSLAFDGDRSTAWRFGNFGSGEGNAVTLDLDTPTTVGQVAIQPTQDGGNLITALRVTTSGPGGSSTKDVAVGPWGTFPTVVQLTPRSTDRITVAVTGVTTSGIGPVGLAEISVPGVRLDPAARLPVSTAREMAAWTGAAGDALDRAPIDVLLHRQIGTDGALNPPETTLNRDFSLPRARTLAPTGTVRLAQGASDDDLDHLAGYSTVVTARASSRAFDNPLNRASGAVDGTEASPDGSSAWVPAEPVVGEWVKIGFPRQRLTSFNLTQNATGGWASKVLVSVDDGQPFETALTRGSSTIRLPRATSVDRVSILITERQGTGFVRFENIGLPHLRLGAPTTGCQDVALVDGKPLQARLTGTAADLLAGRVVSFQGCSILQLGSGSHTIRALGPWAVDDLRLLDLAHDVPADVAASPRQVSIGTTSASITLGSDCSPCYVRTGAGYDGRWRATAEGVDVGAPMVVDGYSVGWRVTAPAGTVIRVRFGPARWATLAWWCSAVAALGALVLLRRPPRSASKRGSR